MSSYGPTAWDENSRYQKSGHKPEKTSMGSGPCQPNSKLDEANHQQHSEDDKNVLLSAGRSWFEQFSQETSFSGLKYIGCSHSGWLRRLLWLLVVLGASGGLSLQVYLSMVKFISHDTNTKISYVTRDQLDFPAVTICNTNMFRSSIITDYYDGVTSYYHGLYQIRRLFPELGLSNIDDSDDVDINADIIALEEYPGQKNLFDFIVDGAHLKEDMITQCQFNGKKCRADYFKTIVTNYGVCFTLNTTLSISTPGKRSGLSIILNAEEPDIIAAPREYFGFKIFVHPRGVFPNLQDFGIELQPGTHNAVRLDVTNMTSLPYGESHCGTSPLKYFLDGYSESNCYLECETDYIVSRCGCRNFYMPGNARFCSPAELMLCLNIETENRHSLCACPNACREIFYRPSISHTSFPSSGTAQSLLIRHESVLTAKAVGDVIVDSIGIHLYLKFEDMYNNVTAKVMSLNDTNGDTFSEQYPKSTRSVIRLLIRRIFEKVMNELELYLPRYFYHSFFEPSVSNSIEVGSDVYWNHLNSTVKKYLGSENGTLSSFKQVLHEAFERSGENTKFGNNDTLEEFIDSVYVDFDMEALFYQEYSRMYVGTYASVMHNGKLIVETTSLETITTEYIRQNMLHVEIFFGDLKVEKITEQPAYEPFQFVCDLGGALGLFFGASLISFIETADFWFNRKVGCCGEKKGLIGPH